MQTYLELMGKIPVLALLLISGTGVIAGDVFAKYWSLHQRWPFFVATIICYWASSLFYIPTLLREGLVITSIIWSLITLIGFLFVGLIIFRESLTFHQGIGVALGVVSLVILVITMK